jgi:hypothetical protein
MSGACAWRAVARKKKKASRRIVVEHSTAGFCEVSEILAARMPSPEGDSVLFSAVPTTHVVKQLRRPFFTPNAGARDDTRTLIVLQIL